MKNKIDKNKIYSITLILIFLVAIVIRIYKFGIIPRGINQDGAMAAVDAKALLEYGTDRLGMHLPVHLTAWGYGQMSALLSYLMIIFIKLFGLNTFAIRLPNLIVSIIGLIFLYLLSKDLFGKKKALIIIFLAAINPWHILQSRWALDCNLFPHFLIAGVYFLNKYKDTKLIRYLIISMIIFGLSMYCYGISIYVVPILLFLYAIYLKRIKKVGIKEIFIAVISYLIIAWPFILTMAINYFKIDSINFLGFTIPYFKDSIRSNDILFFSGHIFSNLVKNFGSLILIIVQRESELWGSIPKFGTMYFFSIPLIILGMVSLIEDKINKKDMTNSNMIVIYFIGTILTALITNNVNVNRINMIFYILLIFNGLGIYWLINNFSFFKYIIIPLYIISFIFLSVIYFNSYSNKLSEKFYADFTKALISTKNTDARKVYITRNLEMYNNPSVSEIITLFYHDIDAKYYQGKTIDELGLHYSERYTYTNYDNVDTNMKDTIYIVYKDELKYFKEPNIKTHFGKYYVIENE